eukprot:Nitzschia sp. Nitz4//scaffold48_size128905//78473//78964//NITZ4_003605-RA/size128905-processed-gene-0.249-mRNA-1//-1//CDS//3329552997//2505//frame0
METSVDYLPKAGPMQAHAVRIPAGADLVSSLLSAATNAMKQSGAQSAFILTAVGSLQYAKLRMANAGKPEDGSDDLPINELKEWRERLEIVSLVGTFSVDGKHLHMSVSDKHGAVFGGHVMEGTIFTTLELVLGTIPNVAFNREIDHVTGFDELVVSPASSST